MNEIPDRLVAALADRYTLEGKLGEGGMASVYLATDLRHNRKVAVKVLKPELAAVVGSERFLSEIETTANLQHPHILPLYDSGDADGFLFYVMPLVQGESLRDRLDRDRQLPVDEAVGIASSVARALDFAHRQGVVHRDIKPANILFQDGQPLVSDFGIALAVGAGSGGRLTETGLSVGTPFYMSPEQATGDQGLGAQSDIYALGCVLYEMLIGEPPYTGATAQAVLGRIIQGRTVSATEARPSVPPHVDAAIRKALEKLPADRFMQAADFAQALATPSFRYGDVGPGAVGADGSASTGPWKIAVGALGALLIATGAWGILRGGDTAELPVTRQIIAPSSLGDDVPWGRGIALAPDGSGMLYPDTAAGAVWRLYYKARESAEGVPLNDTEGAVDPVFSPDGRNIAFFTPAGRLARKPVNGGATTIIAEDGGGGVHGIDWRTDGTILYEIEEGDRIVRIGEDGGLPRDTLVSPGSLRWIEAIEGHEQALILDCALSDCSLVSADLTTGDQKVLRDEISRAWYVEPDIVVFVRNDGAVFATEYDPSAREISSGDVPLLDGVATGLGFAAMQLGQDGTAIYRTGRAGAGTAGQDWLVWAGPDATVTPVDPNQLPADLVQATLSPDGTRAAVTILQDGQTPQTWVKELPNGPLTRITPAGGTSIQPAWSRDGSSILYTSVGSSPALLRIPADGSALQPDTLYTAPEGLREMSLSPDGNVVVFRDVNDPAALHIFDLSSGEASVLLETGGDNLSPVISPDGRWLAYSSDVSGTRQVYIRPFPNVMDARVQVSLSNGATPQWADDGQTLYFVDPSRDDINWDPGLIRARLEISGDELRVQDREAVLGLLDFDTSLERSMFSVADDGRVLLIQGIPREDDSGEDAAEAQGKLILIQNWLSEIRSRVHGND